MNFLFGDRITWIEPAFRRAHGSPPWTSAVARSAADPACNVCHDLLMLAHDPPLHRHQCRRSLVRQHAVCRQCSRAQAFKCILGLVHLNNVPLVLLN
uniref:Uncharacterized protein n=1 Tax=Mycena chlorophos TaxID=658473 RepID=A0ABQ0MAD7_MYCCL|nr:predicted protein [Mycena chlorophos]